MQLASKPICGIDFDMLCTDICFGCSIKLAMLACQAARKNPSCEPLAQAILSYISLAAVEGSQQRKLFTAAVDCMLLPICHQFLPGGSRKHFYFAATWSLPMIASFCYSCWACVYQSGADIGLSGPVMKLRCYSLVKSA